MGLGAPGGVGPGDSPGGGIGDGGYDGGYGGYGAGSTGFGTGFGGGYDGSGHGGGTAVTAAEASSIGYGGGGGTIGGWDWGDIVRGFANVVAGVAVPGAFLGAQALSRAGATPAPSPVVGAQAGPSDLSARGFARPRTIGPPVAPELEEDIPDATQQEDAEDAQAELEQLDEQNRIRRLIAAEHGVARGAWELGRMEELGLRDAIMMDPAERFMSKRSSLERKYGLPPYYGAAK